MKKDRDKKYSNKIFSYKALFLQKQIENQEIIIIVG